jgi:hypothetical protein
MSMKTKAFATSLVLALGFLAVQVRSDESPVDNERIHGKINHAYGDLVSTLMESYRLRLDEYKAGGVTTPASLIRVNAELYEVQRQVRMVGRETEPQQNYLTRAQEIEAVAAQSLDNGSGSRMDYLDAKASRHRAELELRRATKN